MQTATINWLIGLSHARVALLVTFVVLASWPTLASAYKPITHVYLSELARADAIDDGEITIYQVDYGKGQILKDATDSPILLGKYKVHPEILKALREAPAQYRAGAIGPDGYPDLVTGQQVIHPAGSVTPGETAIDLNKGGPGSGPWLTHLWQAAFEAQTAPGRTSQARAFAIGYLTHAAADMYSHTCINHYAGGAFHFQPRPENAVKHVLLEGYIAKRTPDPAFDVSIEVADQFILKEMVLAKPNSVLMDRLLTGDNAKLSLPAMFSRLRVKIVHEIDDYAAHLKKLNDKIEHAKKYKHLDDLIRYQAEKAAYRATNGLRIDYYKHWRDDIDDGLKAWPGVSHDVAKALLFNRERTADLERAEEILRDYQNKHLLSMLGSPDFVGATLAQVNEWGEKILDHLGIPGIEQAIAEMKRSLYDFILEHSFGISASELKKYLENPATYFDSVLNNPAFFSGGGQLVDRVTFDRDELRLRGETFDPEVWPVAYNAVLMSKILMLSKSECERLTRDLGSPQTLQESNALLGFIETLDGSNQWKVNPAKMLIARDRAAYVKIFMQQTGEATLLVLLH